MGSSVFESESVSKAYFKMAVPVVLGMVISIVYNLTDTYFISHTYNNDLIAGVSLCAPVFTLLMAIGNIFGQGGSSLVSRLLGKNDQENLHKVSSFCFYVSILLGAVVGILMLLTRKFCVNLLGADANSAPYALEYFTWMALGSPLVVLSFIHSNLLRAEGMSTQSMISTVSGSVVNIILDPILIFKLNMGASGAAIATLCGYVFTNAYCLIIVLMKSKALSVNIRECVLPAGSGFMGQIFGVGTSAALSNITQSVCLILTNQFLRSYGTTAIAAMGIAQKVNMIVMLVIVGFSFGGAPLVGYYYGSNNKNMLRKLLSFVLKLLSITSAILSLLMVILAPVLMGFFIDEKEMLATGVLMLRTQVASMILMAVILFVTIIFQATGKSIPALALSLSRQGVVFVIVILVLRALFGYMGVIYSQIVSDVLSVILAVVLYGAYFGKSGLVEE